MTKVNIIKTGAHIQTNAMHNHDLTCTIHETVKTHFNGAQGSASMLKNELLDLWSRLAVVKNKDDLGRVVQNKLDTLYSASGFDILLFCEYGKTFFPYLSIYRDSLPVQERISAIVNRQFKENEAVLKQLIESHSLFIYQVSNNICSDPLSVYAAAWKKSGVETVAIVWLVAEEKLLGCLLVYLQSPSLKLADTELLKPVGVALSATISKLLKFEKLSRIASERAFLLELSRDLSQVRDNRGLSTLINKRLKNVIPFSNYMIGILNEASSGHFIMAEDLFSEEKGKDMLHAYSSSLKSEYSSNDELLNKALITTSPLIFHLEEVKKVVNAPLYAIAAHAAGCNDMVIVRLCCGNKNLGFWCLFFEEQLSVSDVFIDLIANAAHQISIAVSQIIAIEEIQKREAEITMLLEFSNAVASVREKAVLSRVLLEQLIKLFDIDEYVIHKLSENKRCYTPLLYVPETPFTCHPDFIKKLNAETDVNDGVFNVTLASAEPVIHDMEKTGYSASRPDYMEYWRQVNLKKVIGVSLRIGQEDIAVMFFHAKDVNQILLRQNLLKSICSQIAVAVSNIISNETVFRQLHEISNYKQQLEEEKVYLEEEIQLAHNYGEMIGESPEMQKTFQLIKQVAPSDSTVLILGETGTGKELIARAIHNNSPRRNKLMVKVNCAALPANLIESELFGHERGSFTGATERRIGKFELANNGTLFLDEIGEMPVELQVKLLRALQEKEIERIGGRSVIKVDVRIIAATNRDLEKEMEEGRFRNDLYYRLNIFPISLAPLRERRQDIPLLASYFIQRYATKTGKKISVISNKVIQDLVRYTWPGNIRELEHLMERCVLFAGDGTLKKVYLPDEKVNSAGHTVSGALVIKTIDDNERDHILQVLKHCCGRIAGRGGAAQLLGVPPSTLNSKIKKLGIRREHMA